MLFTYLLIQGSCLYHVFTRAKKQENVFAFILDYVLSFRADDFHSWGGKSPTGPELMDWSTHYPAFVSRDQDVKGGLPPRMTKEVKIADIGCGFGGLLIALAPLLPETLMIGLSYPASRTSLLEVVES